MWVVKNVLRGTLYVEDLNVKIPPKEYFDLDKLGRDRVIKSPMIKLAFEEGYLQNIKKDDGAPAGSDKKPDTEAVDGEIELEAIQLRLHEVQEMIMRGFGLAQIESRLGQLQQEMAESGAYSDRLQALIQEFRNTLLAKPVMAALPLAPAPAPAQPAAVSVAAPDKMSDILQALGQLQNLVIQNTGGKAPAEKARRGAPADARVALKPGAAPVNGTAQELDQLIHEVQTLREKLVKPSTPGATQEAAVNQSALSDELSQLRSVLVQDFKQMLKHIPATPAEGDSRARTDDGGLSESEMRARLLVLSEKENEIKTNFRQIGQVTEGSGDAQSIADLLSDI